MADVKRTIELVLTATDNASGTVARAGQNIKKSLAGAQEPVYGPANRTARVANRAPEEQRLRDLEAGRYKADRAAEARAAERNEIERRIREKERGKIGRDDQTLGRDNPEVVAQRQAEAADIKQRRQAEREAAASEQGRLNTAVDARIKAEDEAARRIHERAEIERRVNAKLADRLSKQASATGNETGAVHGPAVKPRFDADEQRLRKLEADRLRKKTEAERQAADNAAVESRLREKERAKLKRDDQSLGRDDADFVADRKRRADAIKESRRAEQAALERGRKALSPDANENAGGVSESTRRKFFSGGGGGGGGGRGTGRGGREPGIRLEDKANLGLAKFVGEGAVAIGAMAAVGRALQKIPEAAEQYRAALKAGATPLQASGEVLGKTLADSVPIAGDLGKGLRSLADFLTGQLEDARRAEERAAGKQQRAENARKQGEKSQRINDVANRINDGTRSAADQEEINRIADPDARARKEAEITRKNRLADIDRTASEARQKGGTAEDLAKLNAAAQSAREQAQSEYLASIQDADQKANALMVEAYRDEDALSKAHQEQLNDSAAESRERELESQGMFYTARLDQIQRAYDKEKTANLQQYQDEVRRIEEQGVDVAARKLKSKQRLDDADFAAYQRLKQNRAAEDKQRNEDRAAREKNQTSAIGDAKERIAETSLRLAGRDQEAETQRRKFEHEQEIQQINDEAAAQAEKNKEDADAIRRNAADRVAAAEAAYSLNEKLIEQQKKKEQAEKFKVRDSGLPTGENKLLTGAAAKGIREEMKREAADAGNQKPGDKVATDALEETKKSTKNTQKSSELLQEILTLFKNTPPLQLRPIK